MGSWPEAIVAIAAIVCLCGVLVAPLIYELIDEYLQKPRRRR